MVWQGNGNCGACLAFSKGRTWIKGQPTVGPNCQPCDASTEANRLPLGESRRREAATTPGSRAASKNWARHPCRHQSIRLPPHFLHNTRKVISQHPLLHAVLGRTTAMKLSISLPSSINCERRSSRTSLIRNIYAATFRKNLRPRRFIFLHSSALISRG